MKSIATWLAVLIASLAVGAAAAQQYPVKPVKIVVGFAPGGGSDFIARVIAQKLTERFGTQVIVENRPGAGSTLGSEVVVKSPPDGYTLLLTPASYTVNPSVYKLSFDALNDITPIVQLSRGPYVVAVNPSVPAKTLQELVELAKRDPDKLAYASSGNGSHVHVATALQYVKSGRLRALAVTTPKRIAAAPEVPTVAEAGYPAYEVTNWHGLVGPKGLPKDIVARLNREVNEALKSKEVEKILASDGLEPAGGSPEGLGSVIKNEVGRWSQVVKRAGVKVE